MAEVQPVKDEVIKKWHNGDHDWRQIACVIKAWEEANPRLSQSRLGIDEWFKKFAEELGVQKSNLWRFRKAFQSAQTIWKVGSDLVQSPMDIPGHVSPESIELVEKISRAAPSEMLHDVVHRLYSNEVTRAELRRIWESVRDDVRSKRTSAPRYHELPKIDTHRRSLLFSQAVFEMLKGEAKASRANYFGLHPRIFEIGSLLVDEIHPPVYIVAVAEDEEGQGICHGIATLDALKGCSDKEIWQYRSCFDCLWVVMESDAPLDWAESEPIGILIYSEKGFAVSRTALRNPNAHIEPVFRAVIPGLLSF